MKRKSKMLWSEIQLDHAQEAFSNISRQLVLILIHGDGIKNLRLLDTVRALEWTYLVCASYRMFVTRERAMLNDLKVRKKKGTR